MERGPLLSHRTAAAAAVACVALLAGACAGGDDPPGEPGATGGGVPTRGGEVTYTLEAETTGGWCLPESTLAISGIMVARAIYDTLTNPSDTGEIVPLLAESVEPDETNTSWTVTLPRDGVTFHDGSPLTAEVVKNNVDAWLGRYPGRTPLIFPFVLDAVDTVEVADERTVVITTDRPWPSFPAYLYGGGRLGIMAQAQLDDPDTCDRNLIGTGPFVLEEWVINERLTATANPGYWATDHDGEPLPYLDRITFRPIIDEATRLNALLAGEVQVAHTSSATSVEVLEDERDRGRIQLLQSLVNAEVGYLMFNAGRPPFDSPTARLAVAHAFDRDRYQQVRALGLFPLATGAFPEGTPGHLDDSGFPDHDPELARELVAQYEEETGQPLEVTYVFAGDADSIATAQFAQEQLESVGITVYPRQVEQATLINTALGDEWDLMPYRNLPGGVPDGNYVWWHSGSPVNFGSFTDPVIDELMASGRSETDPEAARATYEEVNRRFSEQVYKLWLNWVEWNIASTTDVGGVGGAPLPGGLTEGEGLPTGHSVAAIWRTTGT